MQINSDLNWSEDLIQMIKEQGERIGEEEEKKMK
jgi:hypothetical protein